MFFDYERILRRTNGLWFQGMVYAYGSERWYVIINKTETMGCTNNSQANILSGDARRGALK